MGAVIACSFALGCPWTNQMALATTLTKSSCVVPPGSTGLAPQELASGAVPRGLPRPGECSGGDKMPALSQLHSADTSIAPSHALGH